MPYDMLHGDLKFRPQMFSRFIHAPTRSALANVIAAKGRRSRPQESTLCGIPVASSGEIPTVVPGWLLAILEELVFCPYE